MDVSGVGSATNIQRYPGAVDWTVSLKNVYVKVLTLNAVEFRAEP